MSIREAQCAMTGRGNSYSLSPDKPCWERTLLQDIHRDKLSLLSTVRAKHSYFFSFDSMEHVISVSHIPEERKKGKRIKVGGKGGEVPYLVF